jgi:ATP-dependent Clp protease ATP-binding subunit ClpB
LETLDRDIVTLQIELESLKNESDVASTERRAIVEMELQGKRKEQSELEGIWLAGS